MLRVESYTHSVLQARSPGIIRPKHFLLAHTLPYAVLSSPVDFILCVVFRSVHSLLYLYHCPHPSLNPHLAQVKVLILRRYNMSK